MHFHFYIFALTRTELNLIPDEPDFEIIGIAAAAVVGRADLRLGPAEFILERIEGQLCKLSIMYGPVKIYLRMVA